MKILIIGGTGHVGSFLAPQLNAEGHQVIVVTRGNTAQHTKPGWEGITFKTAQCGDSDEWRQFIQEQQAEVIADFPGNNVPITYEAAKQHCKHFIACGSLWMFGNPHTVPTPEISQTTCEFAGYESRYQEFKRLITQSKRDGIAFTTIMPPNICGPGKIPLDCNGGRDEQLHKSYSRGEAVTFPHNCNTLVGPCDASDIARAFTLAVTNRDMAAGEMFNVGSEYSLTTPQFVKTLADIYNTTLAIHYVDWKTYLNEVVPDAGANFHFRHHMCPDITKIKTRLRYKPEFTCEQTLERAVDWMRATW